MMRVFKPKYQAKNGKRQTEHWYVHFKDHNDTWRKLRAFSDKAASDAVGRKIEKLVGMRASGQLPGPDLAKWLEGLSQYHRSRLAEWGLLDDKAASLAYPLTQHVEEYHAALLAKDNAQEYAKEQKAKVLKVRLLVRHQIGQGPGVAEIPASRRDEETHQQPPPDRHQRFLQLDGGGWSGGWLPALTAQGCPCDR